MIRKLQDFLESHNIEYSVQYGGKNNDIINIVIGTFAIIKDEDMYMICNTYSANFIWVTYDELVEMLRDLRG